MADVGQRPLPHCSLVKGRGRRVGQCLHGLGLVVEVHMAELVKG